MTVYPQYMSLTFFYNLIKKSSVLNLTSIIILKQFKLIFNN